MFFRSKFIVLLLTAGVIIAEFQVYEIDNHYVFVDNFALETVVPTDIIADHLDLSNLNLRRINDVAFEALPLTNLSLANNHLMDLPPLIFWPLDKLRHLSLANNKLRQLLFTFINLNNLISLDISGNEIHRLSSNSFSGLHSCVHIKHDGNLFGALPRLNFRKTVYGLVSVCINDGIVESMEPLELEKHNDNLANCRVRVRPLIGETLYLVDEGIAGFKRGWYRLDYVTVTAMDFQYNKITEITGEMINDLPRKLRSLNLAHNDIRRVKSGVIVNRNLRKLDLSNNNMKHIEEDAFKRVDNMEIVIGDNPFLDLATFNYIKRIAYVVYRPGIDEALRYIVNP